MKLQEIWATFLPVENPPTSSLASLSESFSLKSTHSVGRRPKKSIDNYELTTLFSFTINIIVRHPIRGATKSATITVRLPYQSVHFQHRISFRLLNPMGVGIHGELNTGMP